MRIETSEYVFNSYFIIDDEYYGSKLRMKAVLGEKIVNERRYSCEFRMEQSLKNHKKCVN